MSGVLVIAVEFGPAVSDHDVVRGYGPGDLDSEADLGIMRVVDIGSQEGCIRRVGALSKNGGRIHLIRGGVTPSGQIGHHIIVNAVPLKHVIRFLPLRPLGD